MTFWESGEKTTTKVSVPIERERLQATPSAHTLRLQEQREEPGNKKEGEVMSANPYNWEEQERQ